jgi:hypothetical protein
LVLLAALGITIIRIGTLLSVHMFLGMLLIGPLLLKLASTGYRFVRYYTANRHYRRKGPPPLALRVAAPLLVASTLVVFGSGVLLLLEGRSSHGALFPIHKFSFFAWLAVTAFHVLGHLPAMPQLLRADFGSARASRDVSGRSGRRLALGAALAAGTVLAVLVLPDFGSWLHGPGPQGHDH